MTTDAQFKTIANFSKEFTAGNTKAAMKAADAGSSDLWKVPVASIRPQEGNNLRIPGPGRDAHVRWLADQIKKHGFYPSKPLTGFVAVEGGEQVIILQDGGCRFDAAKLAISEGAPIDKLPMVIQDRSSSSVDQVVDMLNSNEGKAFTVLEKALGAKRLKTYGKTDIEIADLMGITNAYVGQLLTLAGAPKKIRDMLQAEEISATNAIKMMKAHGEGAADVLGKAVKTAKAKGKEKASAKDDEASALVSRQKKNGPALFGIIGRYLDTAPNIPEPFSEELDALYAKVGC